VSALLSPAFQAAGSSDYDVALIITDGTLMERERLSKKSKLILDTRYAERPPAPGPTQEPPGYPARSERGKRSEGLECDAFCRMR
jgi:hypothetical protein